MRDLVTRAVQLGGLPVDDVLALVLPLFEQVRRCHETGRVAPLRGLDALSVTENAIGFDPDASAVPRRDDALLGRVDPTRSVALDVRRGADLERDLRTGAVQREQVNVTPDAGGPARIVAGWQRWEHLEGVHDEPTDIGSLGELLTALCCGLDLADEDDARQLSRHHRNLFALAPDLHPVISLVASSMLAVHRRDRAQDLAGVIERLATYRDQPEDFDLERILAAGRSAPERREAVLSHLRDRLFDLSRRNPLLHFRATQRTLNLTQASVPLVLDVRSVRAEQLFTWGGASSKRLVSGKAVQLGSLVRWEDAPYASSALDAVISTARRDRAEYGADQLRLVVAFLRWHNVKDDADTPIMSPLVMAPVTLTKQRGVRDSYALQLVGTDAEINPVLRHELREVYGFTLPDTVDLRDDTAIETLRDAIERQARATQPGVSVTTVDRPRIELIRARAQTAMQAYRRRRASSARPSIGRRQYAYSYTRPGWAPLGIQIHLDRIVRQPLPIGVELGDRPVPRQTMAPADGTAGVVETELFTLDAGGTTNPYSWEVDLCSITLANFNYRTLTLVRDYETLLHEPRENPAFDELFSDAPRDLPDPGADIPADDRFLVVPADGSQLTALSQARASDNFVIQGPPGTGKSQIITNLVADYLARGKRVLFVCQKRAALDVVHARLRSQGLDEVCTLIHDSQQDKKEFVHALRDTYERWLDSSGGLAEAEAARSALLADLSSARDEIAAYESALAADLGGLRVLSAVDRLIELADAGPVELAPRQRMLLPSPAAWSAARAVVGQLAEALQRAGGHALAGSPLRVIGALVHDPRADAAVAGRAEAAAEVLERLLSTLAADDRAGELSFAEVQQLVGIRATLAPVPAHRRGGLLDPRSAATGELAGAAAAQRQVQLEAQQAAAAAAGWHTAPGADDARAALEIARQRESSFLRFLSGDWKRVRALVASGFAAPERAIAPTATQALELLVAHYDAQLRADGVARESAELWGHADLSLLQQRVEELRRVEPPLAAWRDRFANDDDVLAATHDLAAAVDTATSALDGFDPSGLGLRELAGALRGLVTPAGQAAVRSAAGPLRALAQDHPQVLAALRQLDLSVDELEFAVLAESLATARATMPALDRLDGTRLADLLARIGELAPTLRRRNAELITARLRDRFLAAVEHSQRSVTGMSPEDRARKKTWATGRREVEHEFGKVRAYKSIRQLASDESGAVVAAMRPVWLMSPSSMADTLPLEADFDVVIFDEASQIPVEEAVPALFRARQVITVGDQMQLPPTQYFQTAARDDTSADDDEASSVGVVLDADSFLAVSSSRLPSTMLLWHYRSRYEALIQFSNAAFYGARLSTIPDRGAGTATGPLDVPVGDEPEREDVRAAVDALLARSISFMRVRDGVYVQRTNPAEARWIAELVRELLARETGRTLGIVAFSEAQQSEIERALERLSNADSEFAARYEAELVREDDGQTVGLFVKNLENVQGDERDVIIMSVCYAPAADGRMRMNFGPINNAGGEKRLNVIFSRSKQHMVLVSTIDHTAVTNTYNDGANTLKNFLRYAAAVSEGDTAGMQAVLAGLQERRAVPAAAQHEAAAVEQLAAALGARGFEVARDVGQSGFRVDLALREPGAPTFDTAVLVDTAMRVSRDPVDERRITQPAALATAGWRVEQVLATEWLDRPDAVVDRIVARAGRITLAKGSGPQV